MFLLYFLLLINVFFAPPKKEKIVIAFYNLENMYDTIDNPMINDDEFIPSGAKQYNTEIYQDKLFKLSTVLSDIGTEQHKYGPAIIGVAEIENDTVLYDLTRHFLLRDRKLKFIHFDSKDARGVDVGLFYHPKMFIPQLAFPLHVTLPGKSKESATTRDILYVKGYLAGEQVHVLVNHWPSRRGGEERSGPAREAAAWVCKQHIDSILNKESAAKIILMGDLNDNPTDKSIRKTLHTVGAYPPIKKDQLFNPWEKHYARGMGTLANKDVWGLFDQIIISAAFTDSTNGGWLYGESYIYSSYFMKETSGRFKGYPMRTWEGNHYRGGFSDHFPTYIVLEKYIH
jgi:hypothetical protein